MSNTIAIENELAALSRRLTMLETAGRSGGGGEGDYTDQFSHALGTRIQAGMSEHDSPCGLGIVNVISQVKKGGSVGTAFSIVTLDQIDELPTDAQLAERHARVSAFLADPLTLRILREFFALRFAGKPMRATAADFAGTLGETPERIDAALLPLVASNTLERGLSPEGTAFYHWDGNNHTLALLLFRA